jgi:hypothetical protein
MLVALLCVWAIGFVATWPAQHDAALAAHLPPFAAQWYPLAVDGIILIAVAAAFVFALRADAAGKWYSIGVATAYTGASLLINYLHGIGWFLPDTAGIRQTPPHGLVAVIVVTAAGAVPVGTHMMVKVAQVVFPTAPAHRVSPRTTTVAVPQAQAAPRADGRMPKDQVIADVRAILARGESITAQEIKARYGWGLRTSQDIRAEAARLHAVA